MKLQSICDGKSAFVTVSFEFTPSKSSLFVCIKDNKNINTKQVEKSRHSEDVKMG